MRIEYAHWAISEIIAGAVFIFIDETYMHFGGPPRKRQKITKPKGADSTFYATHEPAEQFQLMLWGGIGSYGDEIPFPHWVWEVETKEEKEQAEKEMEELNKENREAILTKRARARVPGTDENTVFREKNVNIQDFNDEHRTQGYTGQKGFKRKVKPEQVFKFVEMKRENAKGGIN